MRTIIAGIFLGCAVLVWCAFFTGCALIPDVDNAYTAGRLTAAAYLDTQAVQSEDVNKGAKIAYAVLCRITDGESEALLTSIVAEEVIRLMGHESVFMKELVLSYYKEARGNLLAMVGVVDSASLLEFRRGVDDVLGK